MKALLESVLRERFPPMLYACGYGSGVFRQASSSIEGKMVDTIFVVDKAAAWHAENLMMNPTDYSFLPRYVFNTKTIERVQRDFGGSMWFNTLIPVDTRKGKMLMKYGVISAEDWMSDCCQWNKLYVAGRLQKPVLELATSDGSPIVEDQSVREAVNINRKNALRATLALAFTKQISYDRLFEGIVGLSYAGDVRVGLAESPTKIRDIVKGSFNELKITYTDPILREGLFEQVDEHNIRTKLEFEELVSQLPKPYSSANSPNELRGAISATIRSSSFGQTAKGFLTAGVTKSIMYAASKIGKRFGF